MAGLSPTSALTLASVKTVIVDDGDTLVINGEKLLFGLSVRLNEDNNTTAVPFGDRSSPGIDG
jgi:endonuclease YncB( thermonuclease family)